MVDYKYSNLFEDDSVDKQISIVTDDGLVNITNVELHQEKFEISESICSESELRFGCCEASSIKFTISNVFISLIGKWITVTETLGGNTDVSFKFGRYKVYSDKPTADRTRREVVAYDAMYDIINADVAAWYNSVLPNSDSTLTLKEFRTKFLAYFGIEQEDVTLINDDMVVEKTIEPSELSGKDVITAICEINGCFGHIGRDGKFKYIFLKEMVEGVYPSDTLYPREDLFPTDPMNVEQIKSQHYISATYEDFTTVRINKLQIRQEEDDIGCIYGTGNNCYIVEDNFLVYGKSHDELTVIAANLYSVISKVWYRPAHVEAKGNPCLEVGDGIKLRTKYEIVYTYILQRTLKGIQALRDTYDAEGTQYQEEKVNDVNKSIIQLKGKTNKLIRTVDETRLEMADIENGLSAQIAVNAQQILLKVSKDGVISSINQTAEAIKIQAQKIDLVGLVNADELVSKFATITTLNATKAELNTLIAQKATITQLNVTNNLVATKASIEELDVQKLRIDNLILEVDKIKADYISADTVKANYMEVNNWTSAGVIKAERLDAKTIESKLASMDIVTIHALGLLGSNDYLNYHGTVVAWKTKNINGTTITYLGAED